MTGTRPTSFPAPRVGMLTNAHPATSRQARGVGGIMG